MSISSNRTILHCDLNSFFASVEALSHPEIGDKPMAVSGNPRLRHGIILAKNEAAKKCGVATGEAIWQAKQKCPDIILTQPHHDLYAKYSQKVNDIYTRFTPYVEPFGIDESWLDVTASLPIFGSGKTIADKIRHTVKNELGLTVSVGVSFNKIFSKLGSDYKKPDATTVFDKESIEKIVYRLPVKDMLYVGKSTAETLRRFGINTIGDLASANDSIIVRRFGKMGKVLLSYARAEEDSPVALYGEQDDAKSIGNSITFPRDLVSLDDIKKGLVQVAEKVSRRLRDAKAKCLVIQVSIKGADFTKLTRQITLERPTYLCSQLIDVSYKLIRQHWDLDKPIRLLGISASELVDISTPFQEDLFSKSDGTQKLEYAEDIFFKVRNKFGKDSIKFGISLDSDLEDSSKK